MRMYARVVKRLFARVSIYNFNLYIGCGWKLIRLVVFVAVRCILEFFFHYKTRVNGSPHNAHQYKNGCVCVCIEFNSSAVFALIKSHSTYTGRIVDQQR